MPPRAASRECEEEDLYYGHEDRKRLESLSEVERERILYERYVERVRDSEKKELEQRAKGKPGKKESYTAFTKTDREREPLKGNGRSTYEAFKYGTLRRDILIKIVYRRIMDRLKGYFVKIRLPSGYAVYKISRVYEGKRYEIDDVATNKWLQIIRKKDKKDVNIQSISNALLTEEEYEDYIKDNTPPSDNEVQKMWKKLSREIEGDISSDEFNYSLRQRRRFFRYGKATTRRRIELKALLERARDEEDIAQIEEIEKELKEIEEQEKQEKTHNPQ